MSPQGQESIKRLYFHKKSDNLEKKILFRVVLNIELFKMFEFTIGFKY